MRALGGVRDRSALRVVGVLLAVSALAGCTSSGSTSSSPSSRPSDATAAAAASCPAAPAAPATQLASTLTTPDGVRDYVVWTPVGYDGTKPVPLVVDYHGTGGEAVRYATTFSGMVRDGLSRGYLVVAPQALNSVWGAPGYEGAGNDVAFTESLVDKLASTYCVDRSRVYASGFSLGGGFAAYVSCALDIWAAVAPEGGVNFARPCPDRPPVPAIVWHGKADAIAPYGSDTATTEAPAIPGENYVGEVPLDVDGWAERNGCDPARIDTVLNADVTKRTYGGCDPGSDVVLYVHSGGHTLPGSIPQDADALAFRGAQTMAIDAPKVTLDFFDAHRLARTSAP
jgi:polyhydroxybutyrate depolymerase